MTIKVPVVLWTTDDLTTTIWIDAEIVDGKIVYPEVITRSRYDSDRYAIEGPTFLGTRTYSRIITLSIDEDHVRYFESP